MQLPGFLRRIWYFIRRDKVAADLEEEMRLHMEMRAESLREQGMSDAEATHASRRRFGNVTNMTEASRDMWGLGTLEQFVQDVRFAARRLRQRPGFSVPVIAVLALGIGATTAVFSAVDAAMLRSLPFARAEELVTLTNVSVPFAGEADERDGRRLLDLGDVAEMTNVFSYSAAYAAGGLNLSDDERPRRVNAGVVTATFFSTLGARPLVGRTFSVEEGRPNGPLAVVLSFELWQEQFGGSEVVGRNITLHGRSYAVVGIMPSGFSFPKESDLWIPMTVPTTFATFEPFRGYLPSQSIARLRPGVTVAQASGLLLARWQQLVSRAEGEARDNLNDWVEEVRQEGGAVPLRRELLGDQRRALLILLGATGLLLLIACANVANMLLSDAAMRRREIAVRGVLGATRRRIVRQLLAESILLSLAGAVLGVMLAPAALKLLQTVMPANLAGVASAQLDLRILGFAVVLALITGIGFGLWPAIGATGENAGDAIKSGGGHGATAGGVGKARRSLVIAEVALTVMLLIAGGLMLKGFGRLMAEQSGMVPEQVATLELSFPRGTAPQERLRIVGGAIDRLLASPGVVAAGAVNDLPLRGTSGLSITLHVPGATPRPDGERRGARQLYATGGYFSTMGIELLRGRTFTADDDKAPSVAIINRTAADEWWPGLDPVGRSFEYGREGGRPIRVIGVVADVRERSLDRDPTPQMYFSFHASPPTNTAVVVRGTLRADVLLARLTEAVRDVAPSQAVYNVRTMEQVMSTSVAPRRTNTLLIALFAALALTLSALGVYAVVAYGVAQRTREFGIRSALGATGRDILRLVSGDMAAVIALGIVIGLAGAWALSRVLGSLLYEVDAHDPGTFALVPVVLVVPAVVATLIPAVRAMNVSPTEVMKAE